MVMMAITMSSSMRVKRRFFRETGAGMPVKVKSLIFIRFSSHHSWLSFRKPTSSSVTYRFRNAWRASAAANSASPCGVSGSRK